MHRFLYILSLLEEDIQMCFFNSSKKKKKNVEYIYVISARGSLLENQSSRRLLGADHRGTFCLACTKVPYFQKERC